MQTPHGTKALCALRALFGLALGHPVLFSCTRVLQEEEELSQQLYIPFTSHCKTQVTWPSQRATDLPQNFIYMRGKKEDVTAIRRLL